MDPFIGQIQTFAFNFPPQGWSFCDGQLISIAQNTALFALLGTTYGGNGQTTFALPDLRGRSIVHPGTGPGLPNVQQGESSGFITATILTANMPTHSHTVAIGVNTTPSEESNPTNKLAASPNSFSEDVTPGAVLGGVSVGNAGSNQPLPIRNPYLGIFCSIALQGIFPSRN